jgi:hypothetical protein
VSTATPLDDSPLVPANSLDPQIQLLGPTGLVVAQDDNSAGDGRNSQVTYVAAVPGTYRVGVRAVSGEGSYVLHSSVGVPDPPTVTSVAVRGATGTRPWFEIQSGSGAQIRSVPVGHVDQIRVTFSTDVVIDQNDIGLTGLGDRLPYTFSNFEYDSLARTAVWTIDEILNTDQLTLVLNAEGPSPITNLAGQSLDGDWTNPPNIASLLGSAFPSGNGTAGGDFVFVWTVLPGDGNRDNIVNGSDYTIWADHYFQASSLATGGDFNTNGIVDGADYTIWADHFSVFSPIPAAAIEDAPSPTASTLTLSEVIVDRAIFESPANHPAAVADAVIPLANVSGLTLPSAARPTVHSLDNRGLRQQILDRRIHELALRAFGPNQGFDEIIAEIALGRGNSRRAIRA